jgi:drug/metabolite transporter (DMT)-like permease
MIPAFEFTVNLKAIELLGITYLAIFPTAIAFMLWYQALRQIDTAICSSIALLSPFISLLLAVGILHESFQMIQGAGFTILLGSVLLNINYSTLLSKGKKTHAHRPFRGY